MGAFCALHLHYNPSIIPYLAADGLNNTEMTKKGDHNHHVVPYQGWHIHLDELAIEDAPTPHSSSQIALVLSNMTHPKLLDQGCFFFLFSQTRVES